jgi:DNA-binding transcriptional LysR family regulator
MKIEIADLKFILQLKRIGSLAGLAREENVTPPAITKRLHQLESRIGARLVMRTTRRFHLTHEGHLLAQRATVVLNEMRSIEEALGERTQAIAGKLKVHGPFGFGRKYLAPLMAKFHSNHPKIEAQLVLSDNLILPSHNAQDSDAFDISISIGNIPDSRWVAHPIANNKRILCASPTYLACSPQLNIPSDLIEHACLVLRENAEDVTLWRFARTGSKKYEHIRVNAMMESNDGDVIRQWCEAGKGIMVRSEWDVAPSISDGTLIELLPQFRLPDANIVALVPQSRVTSARVKLFIEFLRTTFHPRPPWVS